MKIAVGSMSKNIDSNVAEIFGRCSYFIIAEVENKKIKKTETIENKNIDQMSGAGILTAKLMAEKNVDVVITKNIGPRAMDVLRQFDITVYSGEGIIKDILQEFIDEKLKRVV